MKSSWDVNASLELCNVLWQCLTHYGLLPYVLKKKKIWKQYKNFQARDLSSTPLIHFCESYSEIFDEEERGFTSDLCCHKFTVDFEIR